MNLNEAMKKWSVFQCLNLAFTFVLSSIAVALVGMFVSEYAGDIGLRLAVLVAGGLFLYWLGMQMVKAIKVQKRTFIQALAGNYISKMVSVWTIATYFLLMYHLVLAWLYIAALFAAGVALYVRSRRVPDPNAAEPPELPQDSAESEKK